MKGGVLELLTTPLQEIPICLPDKPTQEKLVAIVDEVIAEKTADKQADTSDQESQIDEIVFNLYHLTDEEKEIVRNF